MAYATQNPDELITGINVVPLVDIVLVLLIIFMVTANFIVKPAIDMELPKADTGDSKERNQFSLLLGKDGSVAIGENRIDEAAAPAEFQRLFDEFVEEKRRSAEAEGRDLSGNQLTLLARQELTMVLQADADVSHGRVIHFIDEARQVGILKYAFNVDPTAADASAPAR
ncbi:MAG: biopolymer transporter ExbD [Myxococcales bacterium]|nr:MAG: biopolymer transporter ExbD [Myxococcales bacterium]